MEAIHRSTTSQSVKTGDLQVVQPSRHHTLRAAGDDGVAPSTPRRGRFVEDDACGASRPQTAAYADTRMKERVVTG